jgi:holo-[acyl-carrier protein] synthase
MIIGIGCDLVEHSITEQLKWDSDPEMLHRFFSLSELEFYNNTNTNKTVRFISGRFAVKEAVLKCIGTGMRDGISLTEINVFQEKTGAPKISLVGEVKKISDEKGISLWHVSITHSPSYSCAFVIAEGNKA